MSVMVRARPGHREHAGSTPGARREHAGSTSAVTDIFQSAGSERARPGGPGAAQLLYRSIQTDGVGGGGIESHSNVSILLQSVSLEWGGWRNIGVLERLHYRLTWQMQLLNRMLIVTCGVYWRIKRQSENTRGHRHSSFVAKTRLSSPAYEDAERFAKKTRERLTTVETLEITNYHQGNNKPFVWIGFRNRSPSVSFDPALQKAPKLVHEFANILYT